ncbi:MAG: TerC family protein, partial [bacterium]
MLAADLGLFHRRPHEISLREAAVWSSVWIGLALVFGFGLRHFWGSSAALQFFSGYLIEKALSLDNIFLFVLIFSSFKVPVAYQHRVLSWGVLGALVMRGVMIAAGSVLISRYHWILYVFGAFLVFTGIRLAMQAGREMDPGAHPVLRLIRRLAPVTSDFHGTRFFVREPALAATPLFVVLALVETTDLIFAVDSIPAVFAVTQDPFLVYTSNVFAILGLRNLYFVIASAIGKFRYLKPGLAVLLAFVGIKMLVSGVFPISAGVSLGIMALILFAAFAADGLR